MIGEIIAFIVVVVLIIFLSYLYYYRTGWTKFKFGRGSTVQWTTILPKNISQIRFKGCLFVCGQNTKDVTATLNNMARAHSSTTKQTTLALDTPLNPFSFMITGVNDPATVPNPQTPAWQSTFCSLSGSYKII